MNIALISPSKDAYSETFIKAQRELLPFNIVFYSNGTFPNKVGDKTIKYNQYSFARIIYKILHKLGFCKLNYREIILAKSFKENNIQGVLAQYGPTGEAVANICETLHLPLIIHFHGFDASRGDVISKYHNYVKIFKISKKIIVVSQQMKAQLESMGCPEEKLIHITYGPNDDFLKIEPEYTSPHFIALGRFTGKKAPYYTILAFAEVLEKFPNARLTIGGDGDLHFVCTNLIKYLQIEHAVSLPGVLSPLDFQKHLIKSLAFVQHSITAENGDSEGTPVAIIEASAAGLPVISTFHAGIPDVILNGVTGILVEEHDVRGMADAMINLLSSRNLAIKMGRAGKNRILENFTMDKYINNLAQVINNLNIQVV